MYFLFSFVFSTFEVLGCLIGLAFHFQVSLHGGQVMSWKNEQGEELLFTSSKVPNLFSINLFFILSLIGVLGAWGVGG